MRKMLVCIGLAALAGCAAAPRAPLIERLPEGAAGPIAPPKAGPLSLEEVVEMARAGTPSNVIVQKLRDSRSSYAITASDASVLAARGVPAEVIDYLRRGDRPRLSRIRPDPLYGHRYWPLYWVYYPGYGYSAGHGHYGIGFTWGYTRRW